MITNKGELLYNHLGEWNVYITETFQFDLNEVIVKKKAGKFATRCSRFELNKACQQVFFALKPPNLSSFWKNMTKKTKFTGRAGSSQMKREFTCHHQDYRLCCPESVVR